MGGGRAGWPAVAGESGAPPQGCGAAGWACNRGQPPSSLSPTGGSDEGGYAEQHAPSPSRRSITRAVVDQPPGVRPGKKVNRRKRFIFADGGFAGRFVDWATGIVKTTVQIVRKKEGQKGFQPLPRRWIVERTLAWITAHRRLARDHERDPASSAAFIYWAMIRTMARRLARGKPVTRWGTITES